MWLMDSHQVKQLIQSVGLNVLIQQVVDRLKFDFQRWSSFQKSARHAIYHPKGVLELMPCADDTLYSFKYVNGHPENTHSGQLCVAATGLLANQVDGYPLLLCDMTWLTAVRTAAMAAWVIEWAAPEHHQGRLGVIGTGAQAAFVVEAVKTLWPLKVCYYMDIDRQAMDQFEAHVSTMGVQSVRCETAAQVCQSVDVIVTLTAAKKHASIIQCCDLKPGQLICALGGDCPGKTELSAEVISKSRVLVEYEPQTRIEGELQNCPQHHDVFALHEVIQSSIPVREHPDDWVVFDSVGFAIEDFSMLVVLYTLIQSYPESATVLDWVPSVQDPKDLYGALMVGS